MQSHDARILRGAAIPTAVAGALFVTVAGVLFGGKGVVGAALGAVVVAAFFTAGQLALSYAARISPAVMMQAAIFTYLVKVLAVFGLIVALSDVTAWSPKAFSWTVIGCTLTWIVGEVRAFTKEKFLYVEPGGKP